MLVQIPWVRRLFIESGLTHRLSQERQQPSARSRHHLPPELPETPGLQGEVERFGQIISTLSQGASARWTSQYRPESLIESLGHPRHAFWKVYSLKKKNQCVHSSGQGITHLLTKEEKVRAAQTAIVSQHKRQGKELIST